MEIITFIISGVTNHTLGLQKAFDLLQKSTVPQNINNSITGKYITFLDQRSLHCFKFLFKTYLLKLLIYTQACYLGGIGTHDPCNSRAVSYQLDYN